MLQRQGVVLSLEISKRILFKLNIYVYREYISWIIRGMSFCLYLSFYLHLYILDRKGQAQLRALQALIFAANVLWLGNMSPPTRCIPNVRLLRESHRLAFRSPESYLMSIGFDPKATYIRIHSQNVASLWVKKGTQKNIIGKKEKGSSFWPGICLPCPPQACNISGVISWSSDSWWACRPAGEEMCMSLSLWDR